MNILITLVIAPLIAFMVLEKQKMEHGSFFALLITPAITIISLLIGVYGFGINPTIAGFLIVAFIVFSLVGDVYNALKKDHLLYGLIFFAIGHVLLIVSALILCSVNFITTLTLAGTGLGMGYLYMQFKDNLNGIMKIAVPIYMGLASLSLVFAITSGSFFFTVGVIAFYLSDVVLGIHLFWKPEEEIFGSLVWKLYGSGIFLIANSLLF